MRAFTGFKDKNHLSLTTEDTEKEMIARIENKVWYSVSKEKYINFEDMDDRHIQNCIRMLYDERVYYSASLNRLYIRAFDEELRARLNPIPSNNIDEDILLLL